MSSTKESFFVEDGAYGLVEFLFLMMILWGVGAGDVVKIQELACERRWSHTDYITSSALIDIAPLGTNAVTESLVPKNIIITFLMITYMAIQVCFYRQWGGFMLLEEKTTKCVQVGYF